ncbi:MAG: MFS transporter [Paucibacter sp.]|nr:MFS transporter [Roseateles sp.]
MLSACAALYAAYFITAGLYGTYVPLWFESLGLPIVTIGFLMSLPSWTRLYASFAWGWLADRDGGHVRLLRVAGTLSLVTAFALLIDSSTAVMAVAIFAYFSFNAAFTPLTDTVVSAELATAEGGVDARRYGRVRLWGSLGYLGAVLGFGWLFDHAGMGAFVPALLVSLVLLLLASLALPTRRLAAHTHEKGPPLGEVLSRPDVRWFLAGIFLTVLAHQALYCFYSLFLAAQGHSKSTVGLLWGVGVMAEIGWFALQGRMMERGTVHHWLIASAGVAALRFAVTAAFPSIFWLQTLMQTTHAISFAAQHLACLALITRYFPGRLRGRGQALYLVIGYGLSGVVAALGGAWLVDAWGLASAFWAASLAAVAGAWCCLKSHRHTVQVVTH